MRMPIFAAAVLLAASASAAPEGERLPTAGASEKVVIADSNQLVFRASRSSGVKMLSDVDAEAAETIMRINRTRGTWQSYLLYTTPEMKVPASRPGFTITLPPPSRAELERRRRSMAAAEKDRAEKTAEGAAAAR